MKYVIYLTTPEQRCKMKKIIYICNECGKKHYTSEEPIKCNECNADNFGIHEE